MKTIKDLQERINEKAKIKFEKELKDFCHFIESHPIGKLLKISIPDQEKGEDGRGAAGFKYLSNSHNPSVFRSGYYGDDTKTHTNIEEIKEKLIAEYTEKESLKLLNDFSVFQEYLHGHE